MLSLLTSYVPTYPNSLAIPIHSPALVGPSKQYRAVDKPWYKLGHGIVLAYIAIGWLCSLAYYVHLRYENARRDRGDRDEVIEGTVNKRADEKNGRFESAEAARMEKGDQWSGFRYSL